MSTKIMVVTHKTYPMPEDPCYLPVQAGAAIHERLPYASDAEGDSISGKNRTFCELTALYWAWKNLDADAVGLCHYRRLFRGAQGPASGKEIEDWLKDSNVILPKPRNYYIETNYSQYVHAHHEEDLKQTLKILKETCPDYVPSWEKVMASTKGHRFNMFIMRKDVMDLYCEWLFPILFELEKRLDISSYSDYDARVFGFVSERLLDVWIDRQRIRYKEVPVFETEKVNWLVKGTRFVWRKIRGSLGGNRR